MTFGSSTGGLKQRSLQLCLSSGCKLHNDMKKPFRRVKIKGTNKTEVNERWVRDRVPFFSSCDLFFSFCFFSLIFWFLFAHNKKVALHAQHSGNQVSVTLSCPSFLLAKLGQDSALLVEVGSHCLSENSGFSPWCWWSSTHLCDFKVSFITETSKHTRLSLW